MNILDKQTLHFDVAIVGYGPVGETLANLLGMTGLKVAVFEKESSVYHQPRASHIDGEIMRVFQAVGLADDIDAITIGAKGYDFINAEGKRLLELKKAEGLGPHGWDFHYRFHQPVFENVLRRGVERFSNVHVFLTHEVHSVIDGKPVMLKVKNGLTQEDLDMTASYVIGCDGARSLIRHTIGSEQEDLGLHQQWLVIDIKLHNELKTLPTKGIQYCDPARPITFVPGIGEPDRYRWEIMLLPGETNEDMERHESVWKLLSRWVKPEDAILERSAVYTFHSTIAKRWRKGHLIITGDAAHQTPPFLGQGLCAGIRDVSNLAWKLVKVIKGEYSDRILNTYESERIEHVRSYIQIATELGEIITERDPEKVVERDRRMLNDPQKLVDEKNPPLGLGLHGNQPAPVGEIFPQPRLNNGQLLDEVMGAFSFSVIGNASVIHNVSNETKELWREMGLKEITETCFEIDHWLEKHGVEAVILRPDRYILGIASKPCELDNLTANLGGFLIDNAIRREELI